MSTSLNTLDGKWYETARTQNCTENDSDDVFAYISTFSESKISIVFVKISQNKKTAFRLRGKIKDFPNETIMSLYKFPLKTIKLSITIVGVNRDIALVKDVRNGACRVFVKSKL